MMISGHKTRSVFDRYNIVSEDDLKQAALKTWTHVRAQPERPKKWFRFQLGQSNAFGHRTGAIRAHGRKGAV